MAKRLQVILKDTEYREIRRAAKARHMSIGEWVRRALEAARRQQPDGDVDKRIAAIPCMWSAVHSHTKAMHNAC
jgi:hypothetical protein